MAGETVITVVGNLVDDPELRFTPSGAAVAARATTRGPLRLRSGAASRPLPRVGARVAASLRRPTTRGPRRASATTSPRSDSSGSLVEPGERRRARVETP